MVHGLARSHCMNVWSVFLKEPSSFHSLVFGCSPRPIRTSPFSNFLLLTSLYLSLCVCVCVFGTASISWDPRGKVNESYFPLSQSAYSVPFVRHFKGETFHTFELFHVHHLIQNIQYYTAANLLPLFSAIQKGHNHPYCKSPLPQLLL